MTSLVDKWLSDLNEKTRKQYEQHFRRFEAYAGRTGDQLLREHRAKNTDPDTMDDVPRLIFRYAKELLEGKVPQKARGWKQEGKTLQGKPYSQKSVGVITGVIKSFFTYYNEKINLKKFARKDVRLRNPQPQTRKYKFTRTDLAKIFQMASLRDKAILSLGLMGQDESTVSSLQIEDIEPYLSGANHVKVAELTRQKTNMPLGLVLTPEVQNILKLYIGSLKKSKGWLFDGYGTDHLRPVECNRILKTLSRTAGIEGNGKRVSFHCLRAWFSDQLKNLVSDDLIDYAQGHKVDYDGAYILEAEKKFDDPRIIEAMTIHELVREGLADEIEKLQRQVADLSTAVERQHILATMPMSTRMKMSKEDIAQIIEANRRMIKELEKRGLVVDK